MINIITLSGFNTEYMKRYAVQEYPNSIILTNTYLIDCFNKNEDSLSADDIDKNILTEIVTNLSNKKSKKHKTNSVWTDFQKIVITNLILEAGENDLTIVIPRVLFRKEFEMVEAIAESFDNVKLEKILVINKSDIMKQEWLKYGLSVDNEIESQIIANDFLNSNNCANLWWTSSNIIYNKVVN